ncbi:GntR family transcriptional regulator [Micrococcus cohnii]|uniref:DNA-binding GntR family transcriptional regulator n=1 Tax=Micrococcus cohnii TaxID=993416 RepID=A0A7W7M3B3_9MICC|nr:GntR family transcriptional regulator [Micrococcus cohnii]MBB4735467.1 DNA-binding GntR family transcriptional regulator [Micrococcus cohnii]
MRASDRAYTSLKAEILDWTLLPGTVLGEVEQAERLGTSRTPVREALSRLVADGLAEQNAGRGVVVADLSLEQADQLFDLRIALESLLARRAAERATAEDASRLGDLATRFAEAATPLGEGADPHEYYELTSTLDASLDAAADNPYLVSTLRTLRLHLARLRRLAANDRRRLAASALEHADIAQAVADGAAELAEATTRVHLHHAFHHLTRHTTDAGGAALLSPTEGESA